jgi:hypothetical protein
MTVNARRGQGQESSPSSYALCQGGMHLPTGIFVLIYHLIFKLLHLQRERLAEVHLAVKLIPHFGKGGGAMGGVHYAGYGGLRKCAPALGCAPAQGAAHGWLRSGFEAATFRAVKLCVSLTSGVLANSLLECLDSFTSEQLASLSEARPSGPGLFNPWTTTKVRLLASLVYLCWN